MIPLGNGAVLSLPIESFTLVQGFIFTREIAACLAMDFSDKMTWKQVPKSPGCQGPFKCYVTQIGVGVSHFPGKSVLKV